MEPGRFVVEVLSKQKSLGKETEGRIRISGLYNYSKANRRSMEGIAGREVPGLYRSCFQV
jgi:hypothetical protein